MIEFRNVSYREDGRTLLEGVNFSIQAADSILIFGPAVKACQALLKLTARILTQDRGEIIRSGDQSLPWSCAGYVFKRGGLMNNLTLLENAVLPAVYHKKMNMAQAKKEALAVFERIGIKHQAFLRPAHADPGVCRLAQCARAILADCPLWAFEDPLAEGDPATLRALKTILAELRKIRKKALLITAVDPRLYFDLGERFIFLESAKAEIYDSRQALFDSGNVRAREMF
ncbi:MAG: hypothetical protein HY747_09425 [Elusimicrobia bacterium]|nr:hypothetical protein [Elusimicrobiota bacterium]